MPYVQFSETGLPMNASSRPRAGFHQLPEGVPAKEAMLDDAGDVVRRPSLPVARFIEPDVMVPPCPLGTVVTVFDMAIGEVIFAHTTEVEGWTETLHIAEVGAFEVSIVPPMPWMGETFVVEVTA
ncbi:hypothetical protein [Roseivivax sp. THAF197b]|uniref:hypothetical protein n=1 Tax=Roseivivax sp. THAF197b TaxID=2588299 RepID=UPI0012693840|nr:hypothetical protein [Roseivivax sp. THAF197b]QFS83975.1 hypothetical protein FIV09_14155 [Roseivivax sp. THAF197b]